MARRCYIGAGGKAKETQYMYIGIDDVARPIKKCYVGVGGVARPCWTGLSIPEYYGTVTGFSARRTAAAAPVGSVLIVAGGWDADNTSGQSLVAEGINKNLEMVEVPDLVAAPSGGTVGASTDDYAMFGAGSTESSAKVNVYDKNLVVSTLDGVGTNGNGAAASFAKCAIFAGGFSIVVATVKAVDNNLVIHELADLQSAKGGLAGTQNGAYALFGGGYKSDTRYKTVDAYDKNLVKTVAEALSQTRRELTAARAGKYAMFGGGRGSSTSTIYKTVDAYDRNLVKAEAEEFAVQRYSASGVTTGECALFGGGQSTATAPMECYDNKLVKCDVGSLTVGSAGRARPAAGAIGDYALFVGGGTTNTNMVDTCDVFVS